MCPFKFRNINGLVYLEEKKKEFSSKFINLKNICIIKKNILNAILVDMHHECPCQLWDTYNVQLWDILNISQLFDKCFICIWFFIIHCFNFILMPLLIFLLSYFNLFFLFNILKYKPCDNYKIFSILRISYDYFKTNKWASNNHKFIIYIWSTVTCVFRSV